MPPPPIGISGANFTDWAMDVAKKEMKDMLMAKGGEYMTEKIADEMIKKEESKMRAEIEALQRELSALIPPGTFIGPSSDLSFDVRNKISEIQAAEKQREQTTFAVLATAISAAYLLM